jgi:hypothetical protein
LIGNQTFKKKKIMIKRILKTTGKFIEMYFKLASKNYEYILYITPGLEYYRNGSHNDAR